MSEFRQPSLPEQGSFGTSNVQVRNRVLRNTYWLLALSLVPTVLGAMVGLSSGINQIMAASPGASAIIFLVGAFGLMFMVERNKNNSLGVALLLAFTFFMGLMLSRILGLCWACQWLSADYAGLWRYRSRVGTMAAIATTTKRDFSHLQKFLLIGVVLLIVASLANIFLQLPA